MYKPMLGRYLTFMIIIKYKYKIVLKDLTLFFFEILFSYFQNLDRVSKKFQKANHLGFKTPILKHVIPIDFQSWFSHINY